MIRRRLRFRYIAFGLAAVALLICAGWVIALDRKVVNGFEAHLHRQPAVIYAGRLTLQRGQVVESAPLRRRLERLGYRPVEEAPSQPGDYQWLASEQGERESSGTLRLVRRRQDTLVPNVSPGAPPAGGASRLQPVTLTIEHDRLTEITVSDPSIASPASPSALLLGAEPLGVIAGLHRLSMEPVRPSEVPPVLLAAILTMEDRRFWTHSGIDVRSVSRALAADLRAGRIVEGGSTLTQQLVKNLFLGHEQTVQRKLTEAVMALLLEAHYPKEQILDVYLNSIYFGSRASALGGAQGASAQAIIGVGEAAEFYFGRPVSRLSVAEQALLAAMIKSPVHYAPNALHTTDAARARRDVVLQRLEAAGVITAATRRTAQQAPIAAVRRPVVMAGEAPYVIDWVQRLLEERAAAQGDLAATLPGAQIVTTIDPELQRLAESAVREGLAQLEQRVPRPKRETASPAAPLQAALIALDPRTGAVKALVGGRDYQLSQFNRVTQARRQPGSLFKPVVYLAALEPRPDGPPLFTLASVINDEPVTLQSGGEEWTPRNVDLTYRGPVTFRQVAESSINAATVQIASAVGFERVARMAQQVGAGGDRTLPALPSVALGAVEASPLEMATFYATLANGGARVAPRVIDLLVEPERDPSVASWPQTPSVPVVSPEAAYLVTSLLSGVIEHGTGRSVRALGFDQPAAGKTGTSSALHDAWFAGYTPELVTLVWVGYDRPQPIGLTGAQAALPIWTSFMQQALAGEPVRDFVQPAGVISRRIDPASGKLASWRCPGGVAEWFITGTEPTESCADVGVVRIVRGWFDSLWRSLTNGPAP